VIIREIQKHEYAALGQLMVDAYSSLDGFPGPSEDPDYYGELFNMGKLNERSDSKVLVASSDGGMLLGGIVYFSDMASYGSGGTAPMEKNACGIRWLGVDSKARGLGVGRALAGECIKLAEDQGHEQIILHTTSAMQVAWDLYLKLGFRRSVDLDFEQSGINVLGFRLLFREINNYKTAS
jgi:ribosomal protein S18 acetylase RimI-like enzyme